MPPAGNNADATPGAPSGVPRRQRKARPFRIYAAAIAVFAFGATAPAHAGPPDDDWSLETKADDDVLVAQRYAKLRKKPLDGAQWRALSKALGKSRFAAKLERAYDKNPRDVANAILHGRALRMIGEPARAAKVFTEIEPSAGRLRAAVFDLRIDALEDADDLAAATAAIEAEVERLGDDSAEQGRRRALLDRGARLARRGGLDERALHFAEALVAESPNDRDAALALARAARRNDRPDIADSAYEKAIGASRGATKLSLTAERAEALADGRDPARAAALLWTLLSNGSQGGTRERERWWRSLESAHRSAGTTQALITTIEKWLDENPSRRSEGAAWRTLASAMTALGRDPVPAWEAAVKANPKDPDARMGLIEALEAAGQTERALEAYRDLAKGSETDVARGLAMADRLVVNGERARGLALADEIAAGAGKNTDTLLALLDYFNEHDETDRALDVAERLVQARPRNVDARIALGEQLFQMGRADAALEQWNYLPKLIRPAHAGWARLAQLLSEHASNSRMSKLSQLALGALERALAAAPDNPDYLRLRALLEEERREYLAALASWQQVRGLADGPKGELVRAEARTRVVELLVSGVLRKQTTSLREAARREALADLATGATPEGREAAMFLAELYTREQRYHEAAEVLLDLVEAFPEDGAARMDLARAQRRAGRNAEAMATLQAVIDIDPKRRTDALAELSELAYADGDRSQALEAALAAASAGVDGSRALLRLGELHERTGDLEGARAAYEAALVASPDDVRAKMRLADLDLRAGKTQRAAERFREILSSSGPPEVLRAAAQRALDLGEVTGSTDALIDLAVARTQRAPESDEARSFLLDVLDRTFDGQVERWLEDGKSNARSDDRVAALRAPLVGALTRGSVSNRLRAAQHLGRLAFPETAVPLARLGVSLATPRNASRTVREAYDQARVTALLAAGALDDPEALEWLDKAARRRSSPASRLAASWALASSQHPNAANTLRDTLGTLGERDTVLACLGLARGTDPAARVEDLARVDRVAHDARTPAVRATCAFAAASLTPDARLVRLVPTFDDPQPLIAAAAAWRVGLAQPERIDDETLTALWRMYLGPPGLARDASALALSRIYGAAPRIEPSPALPTLADDRSWAGAVNRWLMDVVAAKAPAIPVEDVTSDAAVLAAAARALSEGTPAEREAAAQVTRPCHDSAADPVKKTLNGPASPTRAGSSTFSLCPGSLVVDTRGRPAELEVTLDP